MLDSMTTSAHLPSVLDALAANQLGRALYPAVFRDGPQPANWARFIFLNPEARKIYADWDRASKDCIAFFRLKPAATRTTVRSPT